VKVLSSLAAGFIDENHHMTVTHPLLRNGFAILLAFMLGAGQAQAFSGEATDDVFAALLSMPGAGPETGYWDFRKPDDFTPGSEAALINYLAKKQKAGANVNAYRHFGTLLHHAIRAGKEKTALWLLEHGADPRKTLKSNDSDVVDALALATTYKRTSVARALIASYGMQARPYTPPPPAPPLPTFDSVGKLGFTTEADYAQARDLLSNVARPFAYGGPSARDIATHAANLKQWDELAARLPRGVYQRLIGDERSVRAIVLMHSQSAPALAATLAALPQPLNKWTAAAALGAIADRAARRVSDGANPKLSYTLAPDIWRTLWRYLPQPVDYASWPALAEKIQPELWPDLFASGYANRQAESALGCMPAQIGAVDFKALWPRMEAAFPDIRRTAPRMLLSMYRLAGSQRCYSWQSAETRDKLLFLSSQGIRDQVTGLMADELRGEPADVLAAIKPFVAAAPTAGATGAAQPRFVQVAANCRFELTAVWIRELLDRPTTQLGEPSDQVHIESVQLLEIPGEAECGLLVGGFGRTRDSYVGGDADSFTGPESNPIPSCPDPTDHYEVWRRQGGRIERLYTDLGGDDGAPPIVLVQDRTNGHRLYLHNGEQYGKCHAGRRLPFALTWRQQPQGGLALLREVQPSIEEALYAQCTATDNTVQCVGIPGVAAAALATGAANESRATAAYDGTSLAEFMNSVRKAQHDDYIAAVLALDRPRLAGFKAQGVPGSWTAEAITRVGASKFTLIEKRRRTAWIFADHAQLARALNHTVLLGLLEWLPREDWGPVLDAVSRPSGDPYSLHYVREEAEKKGQHALACELDRAQGLNCGETWGVTR
jgi:hypothetical protein